MSASVSVRLTVPGLILLHPNSTVHLRHARHLHPVPPPPARSSGGLLRYRLSPRPDSLRSTQTTNVASNPGSSPHESSPGPSYSPPSSHSDVGTPSASRCVLELPIGPSLLDDLVCSAPTLLCLWASGHLPNNTCTLELTQYGNRCDWLKDDKFLRDLEGDSVDTEILDEELRSLQEDEPQTLLTEDEVRQRELEASNPLAT